MKKTSIGSMIGFFHPAGRIFIFIFIAVTVAFVFVGWPLVVLGFFATVWCMYFFRDPERTTPTRPGLIVSPADGKVLAVQEVTPVVDLGFGEAQCWRVSIFLNLFDVHVNRMPVEGTVTSAIYRKGLFLNASLDKASSDNERMALAVRMDGEHPRKGQTVGVVQIAGLVARRIVCEAEQGDRFKAGSRFGIIRFGSRAEIYLPPGLQPLVSVGQYMIGGETVLADCASNEMAREGEIR